MESLEWYSYVIATVSFVLMIVACIEVGSNDAANLVNAVFGAKLLNRRSAVLIAGVFVVLGAVFASPVMNTVRKGIFDIDMLSAQGALAIFIGAYLVNTLVLFIYSSYGLPVSTTATLVFSLAGGAVGASGFLEVVNWQALSQVTAAIFLSIAVSGIAGFTAQRFFRGVVGNPSQKKKLVKTHGGWIAGFIAGSLAWFMISKGLAAFAVTKNMIQFIGQTIGQFPFFLLLCFSFTVASYALIAMSGEKVQNNLFKMTAIMGMACMAFAFGQNDLANCASPGLAIQMIVSQGLQSASEAPVPIWGLFGCGLLMFYGMTTKRAKRVTQAEVSIASHEEDKPLYSPKWCQALARFLVRKRSLGAPQAEQRPSYEYDALRASVILAVSASVIAFASSLGLPVSTTYVSFAAVLSTGWGDRVFSSGNPVYKVSRAFWVVTSWLVACILVATACGLAAAFIMATDVYGILILVALNIYLRRYFKQSADVHEHQFSESAGEEAKGLKTSFNSSLEPYFGFEMADASEKR